MTYQQSDLFYFHFRVLDGAGMSVFSDIEGIADHTSTGCGRGGAVSS